MARKKAVEIGWEIERKALSDKFDGAEWLESLYKVAFFQGFGSALSFIRMLQTRYSPQAVESYVKQAHKEYEECLTEMKKEAFDKEANKGD